MKRRNVVRWLLALPLGYAVVRWGSPYIGSFVGGIWKRELRLLKTTYRDDLRVLTETLLPSSLGAERAEEWATAFVRWLEQQDPEAELNHLGVMLRRADLATRRPGMRRALVGASKYLTLLEALRTQARPWRLAQLGRANLTTLVTLSLHAAQATEIPPTPDGENLLLDILSFFYTRPSAADFFHARRIGAMSCRGLEGVNSVPDALPARTVG
jgi:hypothetical protein